MSAKLPLQFQFQLDQDDVCNIYAQWKSSSGQFFITGYEGIPQNLVLNIIFALVVIFGFSFARRLLWNYGRIAIIERNLPKRTKVRFTESVTLPEDQVYDTASSKGAESEEDISTKVENDPRYDDSKIGDTGLFSWIRITFTLSEDFIYAKCGADAVLYLRYQRHLIFLSCLICFCSIFIVLPIHITGDHLRLQGSIHPNNGSYQPSSFAQTTLGNLAPDSALVWVHIILSFFYFCSSVVIMRHFKRSLRPESREDELSHRTVMIIGIQRRMCHTEKILAHINEIYPNCYVRECTFAYETSRLFNLEWYKASMVRTMRHLEEIYEDTRRGRLITGKSRLIMGVCWWLFFAKKIDALDYYVGEVRSYKKLTDYERARTLGRPLGVCFVTFQTAYSAERMIKDYSFTRRFIDRFVSTVTPFLLDRTPQSRYGRKMRAKEWSVFHAPSVSNIKWENYGLSLFPWYLKAIMVNFTVMLLALFFSTPIILIKTINYYITIKDSQNQTMPERGQKTAFSVSAIFYELLPTLLIWVAATTLPSLVSVSDRLIGFWTRTAENRSRLIKTFSFLVTMVVILPSLGLSSILYIVGTKRVKWECIYSPSNAAFYLNYIITSCFLGTTTELWRFPELFYILCKHLCKKSVYENPGIRTATLWEFQIGSQYAWMLLVFTLFTVFSLISPLITPLGVIYMVIKHYVDKHNIFFAYAKCKVDNSVHTTAVNIVIFSMVLLLTIMYVFTNIAVVDTSSVHGIQTTGLQSFASKIFVISIGIIILGMYVDLSGTIGTVIFEPKELMPSKRIRDAEEAASPSASTKRRRHGKKTKKGIKADLDEKFYYRAVPRIPILPKHRYFAPLLRHDFPFVLRYQTTHLLPPTFPELLHYAELSLHHKPLFDYLISAIEERKMRRRTEVIQFQEPAPPEEPNPVRQRTDKKVRFNPVVQTRRIPAETRPQTRRSTAAAPKTWGDILRWNKKK